MLEHISRPHESTGVTDPHSTSNEYDQQHPNEVRVLLLAPNGRDARRILDAISSNGMQSVICTDADALLLRLKEGATAAIVAQEALSPRALAAISAWLSRQPRWSDMPFIVITCGGLPNPAVVKETHEIELLGNVTLLDRPLRADTIRSCLRVAVRARHRQYATRRYQENLSLAIRDLEQFAYSASHDLREPLRTLSIYSELLSTRYAGGLDDQAQLYLHYLRESAKRMEMLVRDLLAYTQAAGFDEELPGMCSAEEQLRAALTGLRGAIDVSRGIVTYESLPDVRMKPDHLLQLFQNLLGNAVKYRRAGDDMWNDDRVRIHISVVRENGFWRFSIADNGIGIEPRFQEQIFGIFKRLHTSDKFAAMGTGANTGIGLAICQKIVERYNGRIWVESALGQGSTFHFTVPC